ncbi:MAG: amidohydrolase family protein [Verrucomicrobia bacterium]|nr:amidohydrolase family protein [Verrucomicrobiota bacterium]
MDRSKSETEALRNRFKASLFRFGVLCLLIASYRPACHAAADLILHDGKVATVDDRFTVHQAIAIQGGRILQTGENVEVLKHREPRTEVVDLQGKLVLPGFIDSHAHPADACLTEFDHAIPPMECIQDVLDYIQARARVVKEGDWIEVRQVFITRLREQRYPTRAELDQAAPKHPVLFATGPDASLNRLALQLSGIDRDFEVTDGGTGFAEKDPSTGEPTGILRNCTRYVKVQAPRHPPSRADKVKSLKELFADYNSVGITGMGEREAGLALMRALLERAQGSPVYLNIPDQNVAAVNFVERAGLARQRPFIRMFLGDNPNPGAPLWQYSIADPAIG